MGITIARLQKLIDGKVPIVGIRGPSDLLEFGLVLSHRRQVGDISDTWLADLSQMVRGLRRSAAGG